jgi:DNA-binding helix-hairpin-helix protein with protein kinase domain
MTYLIESTGATLSLGRRLGQGKQGDVYEVNGSPDVAAKIYRDLKYLEPGKIRHMVSHPPTFPQGQQTVAWPLGLVLDATLHSPVGFLMPLVKDTHHLQLYTQPIHLGKRFEKSTKFLYVMARNVWAAMAAVHSTTAVVGDVNEENIVTDARAIVTILDADSFQVEDSSAQPPHLYRCTVNRPGFRSPEAVGKDLSQHVRTQAEDVFAAAVLTYMLLRGGAHPFYAISQGQQNPTLEQKIQLGWFPHKALHYSGHPHALPRPQDLPFTGLPPGLQSLMLQTFVAGHSDPSARPKPQDFVDYFDNSLKLP